MRRFFSAVLEANWRNKTNNTLRKVVKTELQNSVYFFGRGVILFEVTWFIGKICASIL